MASIARSLRPAASQFSARSCRRAALWRPSPFNARAFSTSPAALHKRFTKEHEWIELSEDGKTGVIGISSYAAHSLGDVVYVELPTIPMDVAAGDSIGAVESVKSASDINSPITCTITEVNDLLEEKPSTINKGPEDSSSAGGWFAKVEVSEVGVKDMEALMDAKAYKEYTEEEGDH
ncbi:glycine cleavage system H protein [Mollisia scopiformis]|uniref:Glycine cleavage system H protein n=1 Tax=Mollisia scopiformis TaxID=149040 RepID=A0A194XN93_MOLSC|nr:glycine cleavage system H protein [Mollisia scopiformis]KUJ21725.1 glycine cleavage system H protein [Mollisia scopiformis]